jgi:hypothetical protein
LSGKVSKSPPKVSPKPTAGLTGHSDKGTGVLGTSDSGVGVSGASQTGEGVIGSGSVNGVHGIGDSISPMSNGVLGENIGKGIGVSGTSRAGIGVYGKGATLAARFDGLVSVNGNLSATVMNLAGDANVMGSANVTGDVNVKGDVILTGKDCAEEFDSSSVIEPGTVVIIDGSGELQVSRTAYDQRVAGVISGAGSFRPGIILGKDEQGSSGHRMPLALSGKVYCKVDAQFSRVEVGSLLTTSTTPGHAMKATDRDKAFGTVIGKALAGLESGRGLIPILVALQ